MDQRKRYWSVSECGWVASPGRPDALATPWGLASAPNPGPCPALEDDLRWLPPVGRARVPGQRTPAARPLPEVQVDRT